MLVKTSKNRTPILQRDLVELTRHQDNAAEADHEYRETAPLQPDQAGMDVTDKEQRMGRPMSAWSIQEKLQKIRPFLVFEKSNTDPSKIGIYIRANERSIDLYKGDLIFVCGMESGISPEFSVIEVEAKPVPDATKESGERMQFGMAKEIRGWRTLLARLLKWGVISAHDIEKHFNVSLGRDSAKWQELLNGRMEYFSHETEGAINVGTEEGKRTDPDGDDGDLGGRPEGLRQGIEKANRCRAEEAGRAGEAGRAAAQADDCSGKGGDGAEDQAPEELLSPETGWIDLVSGPDPL